MENKTQIIPAHMSVSQPSSYGHHKTPIEVIEYLRENNFKIHTVIPLLRGEANSPFFDTASEFKSFDHKFTPMIGESSGKKHKGTAEEIRIFERLAHIHDVEGHNSPSFITSNISDPQFPNELVKWADYHILSINGSIAGAYRFCMTRSARHWGSMMTPFVLDFIHILPAFRRAGIFRQVYKNLFHEYGDFIIDCPNHVCKIAIKSFDYGEAQSEAIKEEM